MTDQRLPIHPYAELFPPMTLPDFERLCDDIQQHVVAAIESGIRPKQALAQVQDIVAGARAAWVDDEGQPLPESIIPAFRERQRLEQLCRRLDGVARDVDRLRNSPAALHLDFGQVSDSLNTASRALAAARPAPRRA